MLKTRIIPTMLVRGRELIKGEKFDGRRRVGNALQSVRVHNARNVDEMIILEIGGEFPELDTVRAFCEDCFMPVTIGGGVKTLRQIKLLLKNGADMVAICTEAFLNPGLIREASAKFGAQAIVVALDVRGGKVMVRHGREPVYGNAAEWALALEQMGAGEILLTSVDNEGTMLGYDLDLIREVSRKVTIPVIAHGGCGHYDDMTMALNAGAHAVAARTSTFWSKYILAAQYCSGRRRGACYRRLAS